MNHNSPPLEPLDYLSSSMSEGDSLSDSDWLDISSNRESDDNDSVMSADSDRDDMGLMPLSRRSSMSVGSSRDGDVEAWEGFVDDSGDEAPQTFEPALAFVEPTADDSAPADLERTPSPDHDLVEDQRVNDALDQSLISTLSASRSSSASAHASIRDLRLSFPDPLTSSRDELNRSYEDVSPSEATLALTDATIDDITNINDDTAALANAQSCEDDLSMPVVTEQVNLNTQIMFEIVLYGTSSTIKWSFVEDLVRKAVHVSGYTLADVTSSAHESTRYLHLQSDDGILLNAAHVILVHDRTNDPTKVHNPISQATIKQPSLAILFLPSIVNVPPDHTLYLPVLTPPSFLGADELSRLMAINDWNSLSIPANKVARLRSGGPPVFNTTDIRSVQALHAHRLFQRLLVEAKKRPVKSLSEHISPVHAVTLFALMSLIVGFGMNTALRRASTPTPTTPTSSTVSTFWGILGPTANHTVFATTGGANTPVMTTHQDFSLSIFNPGSTSLSITSNNRAAVVSTSTSAKSNSHCKPSKSTWTDKVKSAKDIVVRPGAQVSVDSSSLSLITTPSIPPFSGPSGSKSTALSLAYNLPEALNVRVAQLRGGLDEGMELSRTIRRQLKAKVDQSKGKAKAIQERVYQRHDRARGKAKELKKIGEEFIQSASEEFIGRTNMAKKKARDITNDFANSETPRGMGCSVEGEEWRRRASLPSKG